MATLSENPAIALLAEDVENPELSTLHIMDPTGDSRLQWDKGDPAQVAAARTRFDEFKARGYVGHRVDASGAMSGEIRDFDPDAERIIMHKRLVGG